MPLSSASRGAVVALKCPHCGELQARARQPANEPYVCRSCRRSFTRAEVERLAKKTPPEGRSRKKR